MSKCTKCKYYIWKTNCCSHESSYEIDYYNNYELQYISAYEARWLDGPYCGKGAKYFVPKPTLFESIKLFFNKVSKNEH